MQKCDLQVSKLIRKEYGPFQLKNVHISLIPAVTQSHSIVGNSTVHLEKTKEVAG